MSENPKGFVPVMLTPFKDNGAVDFDGLTAITEFYLSSGASGLFANCQSSEMFELTEKERLDITEHVVKVANGAVPVVAAGTFSTNIMQQAEFVKKIYDTGVEAVIAITGMFAKEEESDEVFEENVFKLIEYTGSIPLGFYECPQPYKRVITAEQLGKFAATGRIIYHKDTCLDIDQIRAKLKVTKEYSLFGLYDAYMAHAVESLRAGAAGLSCIQGNFFPELVVWLCNHFSDPLLTNEVDQVQQFLIDHMEVMHEEYPIIAKYYLQTKGFNITTFSRQSSTPINGKIRKDINSLLDDYLFLQKSLELQKK
jgi:4-hydroxy-tetrahydrodipicolinate synthase